MARDIGAACRRCRRENLKLYLKGDRCYSDKCSFERRAFGPGQHGQARFKKVSDYALQLREKQKVKNMYGVLEAQFRICFHKADQQKGVTGENLLVNLERRLDNTIFRIGLASSRNQARQFVLHSHILVNGKKVNIPSFLVGAGDEISVKEKSRKNSFILENLE
ncbi:MAG: 30S ribosomal protein S4, partial [Proteobacteria bacterium]|nr:30S ribosomal protein S4 [Pseudomonadota bacterium]